MMIKARDKVEYRSLGDETVWHKGTVIRVFDPEGVALVRHDSAPQYVMVRCVRLVISP